MNVTPLDSVARARNAARADAGLFTPAQAQDMLRTKCAPWVQDLNLVVEDCSVAGSRLRLPYSPRLTRLGGSICGQALMACADAAMAIAISALFGEFRNIATVGQSISFMRPIAIDDVIIMAVVPKLGSNLIFGEVSFSAFGSDVIAAYATATWALIAPKVRAVVSNERPTSTRK